MLSPSSTLSPNAFTQYNYISCPVRRHFRAYPSRLVPQSDPRDTFRELSRSRALTGVLCFSVFKKEESKTDSTNMHLVPFHALKNLLAIWAMSLSRQGFGKRGSLGRGTFSNYSWSRLPQEQRCTAQTNVVPQLCTSEAAQE